MIAVFYLYRQVEVWPTWLGITIGVVGSRVAEGFVKARRQHRGP